MNLDLLRRLTAARGIAGFERPVFGPNSDRSSTRSIPTASAISSRRDTVPAVLIAAQMDELGFLVRHVDDRELYVTSDRVVSRVLDDRLGLYVMIEAKVFFQAPR